MKKKIGLGLILVFAVMQIFTIDKTPYEDPTENDILAIEEVSTEVSILLKVACYDCHSNQIKYPWYSNLAPVSWWLQDHIDHARSHLNFSEWGTYSAEKREHKAEEGYEEVEEGEMPLDSYVLMHQEANLSKEQQKMLVAWFMALEEKY